MSVFLETMPFTAVVILSALAFVAVPLTVGWILRYFSDDHPVVFCIVMTAVIFLEFNLMISLTFGQKAVL